MRKSHFGLCAVLGGLWCAPASAVSIVDGSTFDFAASGALSVQTGGGAFTFELFSGDFSNGTVTVVDGPETVTTTDNPDAADPRFTLDINGGPAGPTGFSLGLEFGSLPDFPTELNASFSLNLLITMTGLDFTSGPDFAFSARSIGAPGGAWLIVPAGSLPSGIEPGAIGVGFNGPITDAPLLLGQGSFVDPTTPGAVMRFDGAPLPEPDFIATSFTLFDADGPQSDFNDLGEAEVTPNGVDILPIGLAEQFFRAFDVDLNAGPDGREIQILSTGIPSFLPPGFEGSDEGLLLRFEDLSALYEEPLVDIETLGTDGAFLFSLLDADAVFALTAGALLSPPAAGTLLFRGRALFAGDITPVPLPGTLPLLLAGLALIGFRRN
ncbi:MAG: PEP-CTERM sorting domain-containing protein [Pseudomonadota bacterium]